MRPDGITLYYVTDQVDSVSMVLNEQGKPLTRFEYMPYGEEWITKKDPSISEKHNPKFNSQELDEESGFYYYNARHYDPEIARFVSPDSVIDGEHDVFGWNRYMYVKGNPVGASDPTGNLGWDSVKNFGEKVFNKVRGRGYRTNKEVEKETLKELREYLSLKAAAKRNYNPKTRTTKVNGIVFHFVNRDSNSPDKIFKIKERFWKSITTAAMKTDVTDIYVNHVDYGPPSKSHQDGRAMDIGSLKSKDGTVAYIDRKYNKETEKFNKENEPALVKKFSNAFMKSGGQLAWTPWRMNYKKNLIDTYPGVGTLGAAKNAKRKKLIQYAMENYKMNEKAAKKLFNNWVHHHHGHYSTR
jgi:RHS repeat-associated protein